ncbi:DUF397 domain-containing protein [Nocardiopsis sp. NPDC058789]|uniref:DUF397 domain-containing protein n=1 Tax=Nocardiopsis eucommiae TaxID=2831970 RepID=A0A975L7X7_9ACTN|nr:DUF397 domain-containing protein [Nocardiopsis eucommiae]
MTGWRKSTYSSGSQNCVEAREYQSGAAVRDTQNRELGHLTFGADEWSALLDTVSAN